MALRSFSAGLLLATALAACSGAEPEAEEATAPDAAAVTAPVAEDTAVEEDPTTSAAATDETAAEDVEKLAEATPAPAAKPVTPAPAPVAEVVKVAAVSPPASYNRCLTCHTADKGGEDRLGPNLYGVFGTAAAQGGFAYSAALKESGLVWDEATMHKWLENPRALVPGNRMSFPGLKDAAKRQEIIDFLKAQR